jgi:hypothetical protein
LGLLEVTVEDAAGGVRICGRGGVVDVEHQC